MIKKSVFDDEGDLLSAILKIHCKTKIQVDPMYFKGNFYKKIEHPDYFYDISPRNEAIEKADAKNLPLGSGEFETVILDPPFLFEIRNRVNGNYGANTHGILKGFAELESLYKGILKEAHRILKKKGVLIFKCQDFTDSKTTMTHCFVYQWAIEQGFYAKDLAILVKPLKVSNGKLIQRHLRKIHTYFWVFQKQ